MKIPILLFILLSALYSARASDTLTIRQIYNFDVGDTFDYKISYTVQALRYPDKYQYNCHFRRYVVAAKWASPGADTLYYKRMQLYPSSYFDTISVTHLDSTIIYTDTSVCHSCNRNFSFYTSNNKIYNSMNSAGLGFGVNKEYGDSIGCTDYQTSSGDIYEGGDVKDSLLIYYSKANQKFGTPYYVADGASFVHFTPLPEECAVWTKVADEYNQNHLWEQIRTGTKILQNGHVYVELIYRSDNQYLRQYTPDSLIGYFRNDTLGQKILFRQSINGPDSVLYNFKLLVGSTFSGGIVMSIDTILVDGHRYTRWNCNKNLPRIGWQSISYVEGIGGLQGLIIYKLGDGYMMGDLKSLCICGQAIYPNSMAVCLDDITGIKYTTQTIVNLYPNPTTDLLHLTLPNAVKERTTLILSDLLGQQVYSSTISEPETTHDISSLPSGIYTWRIVSDNTILKTGKVVKE